VFGRDNAIDIETVEGSAVVVITNRTQAQISFILFIVPSFIAGAAVFPWRRFLEQIKLPGGVAKAGMATLHRLLNQTMPAQRPKS
jgi:hypothetical protein